MCDVGKKLRLARLLRKQTRRMLCVPIDHGMQVGVIPGLEDPKRLIEQLVQSGVDALIVNPGMLKKWGHLLVGGPGIILRLDQTTMWRTGSRLGYKDTHTRQVATVEEAVSMGADAVITYMFTCGKNPELETACMEICGEVANHARCWGIVHIIEAMAAKGGFADANDPKVVAMNCRIAGELGADIIKTDWCGRQAFEKIAASSLAPVGVAGGSKLGSTKKLLTMAEHAIKSGSIGLFFGRNVFGHSDPLNLISELSKIVHKN